MIEVSPNLWVGSGEDFKLLEQHEDFMPAGIEWFILTCAKEPWHRAALGYTSAGAPKEHPEYLFARRGNRLILNMVDADKPDYFPEAMIDEGLRFIGDALKSGHKVLVHCNQGESRGPGMALLWMLMDGNFFKITPEFPLAHALKCFKEIYPPFNPKAGILGVIQRRIFGGATKQEIQRGENHSISASDEGGDGWLMRMK